MNPSPSPADTHPDRVKLPFQFDVQKLQAEVSQLNLMPFIYYNVLPLRSPAHIVDPANYPAPDRNVADYADGSWAEWLDTGMLKRSTYLNEVVDTFKQHTKVTLVRLLRLEPGGVVRPHTDPTLGLHIPKSVVRLTIPIFSEDAVEFYLNDEIVPMKPGECWYMRLTDTHYIYNKWNQERINLTIDMIPNDWVRNMILGSK